LSASLLLWCCSYLSLFVDVPISTELRSFDLPGDLAKFINLSEVFAHGMGVLVILVGLLSGAPHLRKPLFFAALLTATSGLLGNGLKSCFLRVRPNAQQQLRIGGYPGAITLQPRAGGLVSLQPSGAGGAASPMNLDPRLEQTDAVRISSWDARLRSFPSGHAATAWGLGIGLSLVFPRVSWLFGMLAILASVQRLTSGAHFPSDVLAGAAIAFACAAALLWFSPTRCMLTRSQ
jgi:membrane-associated phospholipid phosphatase